MRRALAARHGHGRSLAMRAIASDRMNGAEPSHTTSVESATRSGSRAALSVARPASPALPAMRRRRSRSCRTSQATKPLHSPQSPSKTTIARAGVMGPPYVGAARCF